MIFETKDKKRWHIVVAVFTAIVLLAMILIIGMIYSFFTDVKLSGASALSIRKGQYSAKLDDNIAKSGNTPAETGHKKGGQLTAHTGKHKKDVVQLQLPERLNGNDVKSAFLVTSDDASVSDLKVNINKLNMVIPDYFTFIFLQAIYVRDHL